MFRSPLCDTCDQPTGNRPNMLGDYQCDDCAERSYDHWCENFYGGSSAPSLEQQMAEARRLK